MKKIVLILIIFTIFMLNVIIVSACSCMQPEPPLSSLDQSTAVFSGKVTEIKNAFTFESLIGIGSSRDPKEVTIEVSKVWKGSDYKTIIIETAMSSASCGYPFKVGEEYVVYAYGEEGKLTASLCSRTRLLRDADVDFAELGEGKVPSIEGSNKTFDLSGYLIIFLVLVIGLIFFVLVRKRKK
jgi:preprotein translocase subunit SecG